jgi:gliding motility-associated-like protein
MRAATFFKLFMGCLFVPASLLAQSNDCSTATTLPVTANCSSPTAGTTASATQSIPGCAGTADDDVWYQFTATATAHKITVTPSVGMDPVVQVFSGTCAALTSLVCRDLGFSGDPEIVNLTGLTIGNVYRVRVYHYAAGAGSGTFTICCTVAPPAPGNNECAGATNLNVNTVCTPTAGTTEGATQSMAGCSGNADDDVWYSFVATNASQTITVTPTSSNLDLVFQVFSGSCAALNSESCVDLTFMDDPETAQVVGLTAGQTYYIRVYDYYAGSSGNFNICVTGPATSVPTNDNPCSALALPAITSNCNYLEFTTVGATNTATPGAPSACIGGSGAMIGGFSASTIDVWFSMVVPASGNVYITSKPNMGAGRISDGVMVLYSGAVCSALTQIQCSDDTPTYPGAANDGLPLISATGLTPGSTVWLRYFGYGTSSGTFGFCVSTATNDNCANSLYICDINGYSASTSAAYTADRPCNMFGNNETNAGVDQPNGTNTGGIFGQGGPWGSGSPAFDVNINNNSWIRFTASATTAVLNVSISDCWVGNYPSGGVQMQIFSSTGGCCNFTPVSDFKENSTGFTITANNLTVGSDYYLMVDGFAGDICNYTITAQSGVLFPNITPVGAICSGQSVNLTAPAGATSYEWQHNGALTQSVNVTPPTTQSYSVEVTGLCGYKQTLSTTVTVNPVPAAPTVSATLSVCNNQTLNLTASTVAGGTYSWTGPNGFTSSLQNPSIANVSAVNAGVYSVTVTVNGCTSPAATTTVTVNPIPSAPVAGSNSPVCPGQSIDLTASNIVNATYTWTGPSAYSSGVQNPSRLNAIAGYAGTYFVTATVNGCTSAQASTVVVVNPTPATPVASSNSPVCTGNTINLSATTVLGAAYTWSGPNAFSASTQNASVSNAALVNGGTYSVTATVNGCPSAAGTTVVTVNPTPATPAPTSNSPLCEGSTLNLSVAPVGGATYTWTGPNSFSSTIANPSIPGAGSANNGTYFLTTTVNGCTSAVGSTTVTVNPPAQADAGTNLASCNGAPVLLAGTIGGAAGSATWSGGTGTFDNTGLLSATYTPGAGDITAGTVTLTLTTDNPAGPCSFVSDVVTITISSSPSANFSYTQPTYCQSNSDPSPVFGGGASGGTFSAGAGLALNTGTGTIDLSGSTPGTYTVTNSIAANGSCPGASDSAPITIVATPATPTATSNPVVCDGGTINLATLTVAGAAYNWTGPNGFSSTTQNPAINPVSAADAGNYNVIVTVNGCPSAFGTTPVAITPLPVVTILNGASTAICTNDSVTLTASGATTYVWSTTETTTSITVQPLAATTYTVTGTENGCDNTDQITVNINTPAVLTTIPTANQSNCDLPTGSVLGLVASGNGTFTYLWTDASGNAVGVTSDLANVPAGDYSVEITDINGCTAVFGPYTVNNFPTPIAPVISIDNANPCLGGSFTATASTIVGVSYSWNGPGGFTASGTTISIDPIDNSNQGNYCVIATVNGCPSSPACQAVSITPLPNIDVSALGSDSSACINETITLSATGGNTYTWTGPDGFTASGNTINILALDESQEGYYVVTGNNGCTAVDSILVMVAPSPVANATSDVSISGVYCEGATAQLSCNGATLISWSGPNGFSSSQQNPVIDPVNALSSGWYIVTITDANNCSASDSVDVNYQPGNNPGISGDETPCPGATLVLEATDGSTYVWSGPNNFTSNQPTATIPNVQANQAGDYMVTITDSLGCTFTDTITVAIVITPECLRIPELVTPDGDGNNDEWDIEGLENYPEATVQLFNRWGNLIFEVSPYTQPWKGETNKGLSIDGGDGRVPFGTYFYLIRLNDPDGNEYKGYIELQY